MEFLDEVTTPIRRFMCKLHGMTNDHNYEPLSHLLFPSQQQQQQISRQESVNLAWAMLEELRHVLEASHCFPKQMRHWMDTTRPTRDKGVQTCQEMELVDSKYVQITCSGNEFNRRIKAFIKRKRIQADAFNRREFCKLADDVGDEQFSCARANLVHVHRRSKKSLVRIERVFNNPQMKSKSPLKMEHLKSWPPVHPSNASLNLSSLPDDAKERISNLQSVISPKATLSKFSNVYGTLQDLEKKVLYLETVSPEYFNLNKTAAVQRTTHENALSTEGLQQETSSSNFQDNMNLLELRMEELKSRLKSKV